MEEINKDSKKIAEIFSCFAEGFTLSNAIFDDYCEAMAKIEKVEPSVIRERIQKKKLEYFEKYKKISA